MEEHVNIKIDGKNIRVKKGLTVLEAALNNDIYIPNLCFHPDLSPDGSCRLCVVEIDKIRGYPTSCTTPVEEGMKVKTKSPTLDKIRKLAMEFSITSHPAVCLECDSNYNCEFQILAAYLGIDKSRFEKGEIKDVDNRNPLIRIDKNKCILCGRCVRVCNEVRGVQTWAFINRGKKTEIGTSLNNSLADSGCVFCTACAEVCPTGAISDKNDKWFTWAQREKILLPCRDSCPAHIDIPKYCELVSKGRYSEANAVIREKIPFPGILGRVCFHPCEEVCRRESINLSEPINIREIKRFAADHDDKQLWRKNIKISQPTGKKIAIIGAGPAGLTAGYYLKIKGHEITIFEKSSNTGGMMRWGIPAYRLPRNIIDEEVDVILDFGIDLKTNSKIESLDKLFDQGFNAVIIAIGADKSISLCIEGEDSEKVLNCIDFLRMVAEGKTPNLGKSVAIIGGGNAAIDSARTALRLGVENVELIYRRTKEELPASLEEIADAEIEGVKINYLQSPKRICFENECINLETFACELGEMDESGRRKSVPKEDTVYVKRYDTIIIAIGQTTDIPVEFGLKTTRNNLLEVDSSTLETSKKGVFAIGDVVLGPKSVIDAIATARQAASSVDIFLGGDGIIDQPLVPDYISDPYIGKKEGFVKILREKMPRININERKTTFKEVELGFAEHGARIAAERCLRCQLRLQLSKPLLPPIEITAGRLKIISE
jgi:formate dehydrogenase beta subunit